MYDPRLDSVIIHPPAGRNIYLLCVIFKHEGILLVQHINYLVFKWIYWIHLNRLCSNHFRPFGEHDNKSMRSNHYLWILIKSKHTVPTAVVNLGGHFSHLQLSISYQATCNVLVLWYWWEQTHIVSLSTEMRCLCNPFIVSRHGIIVLWCKGEWNGACFLLCLEQK